MTLRWTKAGPCFWIEEWGNYFIRQEGAWFHVRMIVCDEHVDHIDTSDTLAGAKRRAEAYDRALTEAAA